MNEPVGDRHVAARVREARKKAGLTQEAVAEQLRIPRTSVVAIERAERRIQPSELVALASMFGRQVHDLVKPTTTVGDLSAQFRMALQSAPVEEELEPVVRDLQSLAEDYLELERLTGSILPKHYPPPYAIEPGRAESSANDIALRERNRLGLGDGPLVHLRDVLENDVGLRVFGMNMPGKVAALFAYSDETGGCIGFNSKQPHERQRMSIAHEYGHFLTRRERAEITILPAYRRVPAHERAANAFAVSFLMPETGLRRRFNDLRTSWGGAIPPPSEIVRLASLYEVSFQGMMIRLEDLRLIPSGKLDQLDQAGFKVEEAKGLIGLAAVRPDDQLLPTRYRYLAVEAFVGGRITEGQLARFMRVDRLSARSLVQQLGSWSGDAAVEQA